MALYIEEPSSFNVCSVISSSFNFFSCFNSKNFALSPSFLAASIFLSKSAVKSRTSCFLSFSSKIASHWRSASTLDSLPSAIRFCMVTPRSSPVLRLSCLARNRCPVIVDMALSTISRGAITSSTLSICFAIASASAPSNSFCFSLRLYTLTFSADTVWLVATSRNCPSPSVKFCALR